MSAVRPTLFVCNHSSYLDITVLGSMILGSFVAKTEVASWPFFGMLAKLQRTIFVDRRRHSTHTQRDDLLARLTEGDNVILFPEGTSNDGNRVLPFRSALFSVAEPRRHGGGEGQIKDLIVQPVSIAYVRLNGLPVGHGLRPLFAWYGDMELFEPSGAALQPRDIDDPGRIPSGGAVLPLRFPQGAERPLPAGGGRRSRSGDSGQIDKPLIYNMKSCRKVRRSRFTGGAANARLRLQPYSLSMFGAKRVALLAERTP